MSKKNDAKPRTRSEIISCIAEELNFSKKEVKDVFLVLENLVKKDLGSKGPGIFTIPGLAKIRRVQKPSRPARKGTNPFTGEPMVFKAKPATNVVKIKPTKNLKECV